jgi:hypothetical protein
LAGESYTTPTDDDLTGRPDAYLANYSDSGVLKWKSYVGGDMDDAFTDAAVDGQGNVYVPGYMDGDTTVVGGIRGRTILSKYDAAGALIWQRKTSGGHKIAIDTQGGFYLAGSTSQLAGSPAGGNADAYVARYDDQQQVLWERTFGTPNHETIWDTAVSRDGGVIVAGQSSSDDGADALLIVYDALGNLEWSKSFANDRVDRASAVAVAPDGCFYVSGTGFLTDSTSVQPYLMKLSSSGDIIWLNEFDDTSSRSAWGIGLGDEQQIYVAGNVLVYGGPNRFEITDSYLASFREVPEPAATVLGSFCVVIIAVLRRRSQERAR